MAGIDLIKREDAIEAFANYIYKVDQLIGTGTLSAYDCTDVARSVLEELPSAVPQLVRCRDCKYFQIDGNFMFCNSEGSMFAEVTENDYCSYADRRTDAIR